MKQGLNSTQVFMPAKPQEYPVNCAPLASRTCHTTCQTPCVPTPTLGRGTVLARLPTHALRASRKGHASAWRHAPQAAATDSTQPKATADHGAHAARWPRCWTCGAPQTAGPSGRAPRATTPLTIIVRDGSTTRTSGAGHGLSHPKYMLSVKRVGLNPVSTANGSTTRMRAMGHKNTCAPQ